MMATPINVSNLLIGYSIKGVSTSILPPLSFSINKGEMVCLIGPNGCGKSTLLRTLASLQSSLGGDVLINNKPLHSYSSEQLAAQIALVLTDSVKIDQMKVKDLVAMGRIPYRRWFHSESSKDLAAIEHAINLTQINSLLDKPINSLSDGERQRCFIAKALAQESPIILLDEPTAHLDVSGRIQTMTLLGKLAYEHDKTILISTHELDFALQTADRIFLMKQEIGIVEGVPEDIVLSDQIGQTFCNKDIRFDLHTGNFQTTPQAQYPITLMSKGEGYFTYWTERALVRKGYSIIDQATVIVTVDERKKIWVIDTPSQTYSTQNISEMLDCLKRQFTPQIESK